METITNPELTFRRGKKVSLRSLTEDDAPILAKWMNDEEVSRNLIQYRPQTTLTEIEWIKDKRERKKMILSLVSKQPVVH